MKEVVIISVLFFLLFTCSLKVVFRLSPKSPVVRFCYQYESKLPYQLIKKGILDEIEY